MSDIIREFGIFRFINRTRYNSEDIGRLFEEFAAAAVAYGAPADKPLRHDQYKVGEGMIYDFGDYNPTETMRVMNTWDNGKRVTKEVINYVNGPGYSPNTKWKINILPPHKLYSNPVEALAADQNLAPAALTEQLLPTIMGLFRVEGMDWQRQNAIRDHIRAKLVEHPQPFRIRIEAKRESPQTSSLRKNRVALGAARGNFMNARENLRAAFVASSQAQGNVGDLIDRANQLGFAVPVTRDQMNQLVNQLRIMLDSMETCEALDVRG